MTLGEYRDCAERGRGVMVAQNAYGPDSPKHTTAYNYWEKDCGLEAITPKLGNLKIGQFPVNPRDWAELAK